MSGQFSCLALRGLVSEQSVTGGSRHIALQIEKHLSHIKGHDPAVILTEPGFDAGSI